MPQVLKIDLSNLQAIVEILKARDLDGQEVIIEDFGNGVAFTPILPATETKRRLQEQLDSVELNHDSPDLDSQWWIETIKSARVNKEIKINFDE
jgi:hypothetical protein